MNPLVSQARECHRKAMQSAGLAHRFRVQRDDLIRRAYTEGDISYGSLAKQVGCSPQLIAKVVQNR